MQQGQTLAAHQTRPSDMTGDNTQEMSAHPRPGQQVIQCIPKPPNVATLHRKITTTSERHPQEFTILAGTFKLVDDEAQAPQLLDDNIETTGNGPGIMPQGEEVVHICG
eukprot:2727631-Pyramimonas_sp.AAC.1